jgi:hypothetical protein
MAASPKPWRLRGPPREGLSQGISKTILEIFLDFLENHVWQEVESHEFLEKEVI